jgi:hypothetical protein
MNRFIEIQNEHDENRLHYYKTLTIYTNELLQENKIELKVNGFKIISLKHYYSDGMNRCSEIIAYTKDSSYNVGIPIFDKVEEYLKDEEKKWFRKQ